MNFSKSLRAVALGLALSASTFLWAQTPAASIVDMFDQAGIVVHSSTNLHELEAQYNANKAQWDAALQWLNSNDLAQLTAGRHKINDALSASVEDSQNGMIENRASESHYHHIDLQLVVRGVEGFALLDHESSAPNTKWKEDVIRYSYDPKKLSHIVAHPGTMMLFFPSDWHIAKVQTPFADQTLRVVVIKLDYVEKK